MIQQEGILLESVLEGMAEYYSAELAEKVVRGMTENVLKGISNGGQITFGYKVNADRKFEPHETFAPILQEIFTMYAMDIPLSISLTTLTKRKSALIGAARLTARAFSVCFLIAGI